MNPCPFENCISAIATTPCIPERNNWGKINVADCNMPQPDLDVTVIGTMFQDPDFTSVWDPYSQSTKPVIKPRWSGFDLVWLIYYLYLGPGLTQ